MKNPFRKRWTIWIIGRETGHATELTFCRSWRRQTAMDRAERISRSDLTQVKVRPIK